MSTDPVLVARGIHIRLDTGASIVSDVDLSLAPGEVLGLVGESGSGKTTTALALLGFQRPGAHAAGGSVRLNGQELLAAPESETRRLRGKLISYVPQDPSSALNPALRIGPQIAAMTPGGKGVVGAALERVRLPGDRGFQRRYPHQLSGGQKQRVAIAAAFAADPPVVILDEPTTGLDVVTQAAVLEEVQRLRRESGTAMVYVSHDLAVVASIADRVAVMYAGRIIEVGPTETVLSAPRHPYTRGLVEAVPDHRVRRAVQGIPGVVASLDDSAVDACVFAPRCGLRTEACVTRLPDLVALDEDHAVRCLRPDDVPALTISTDDRSGDRAGSPAVPVLAVEGLHASHKTRAGAVIAARDVSFAVPSGGCLAVVGESGSGKTTLARCLVGLHSPDSGRILLDGQPLAGRAQERDLKMRRRIQMVFQDPRDSLNPRQAVGDAIARPARLLHGLNRAEATAEVDRLLDLVRLPLAIAQRLPGELSGGERQRVAIARALAARPDVVVCDEITSALDVSVQAAILELLRELRTELGTALVFITHDLGVVASIADEVIVLEGGQVREHGAVQDVLTRPTDGYTRSLIEAAPSLWQSL